jgi:hypothetical protein
MKMRTSHAMQASISMMSTLQPTYVSRRQDARVPTCLALRRCLQVSRLARSTGGGSDSSAGQQHQHWFTATPDPQRSVYKPFAFPPASSSSGGSLRQQQPECSPHTAAPPAARNPPHPLWQAWKVMHEYFGTLLPPQASLQLRELEAQGLDPQADLTFAVAVQREMQLYGAAV